MQWVIADGLQTKIESPAGHDEVSYRRLNLRFSYFGQFYPIVPRIGDYVTEALWYSHIVADSGYDWVKLAKMGKSEIE